MPPSTAPQSIEEFHQRVGDLADHLPKRLRQCADYLTGHTDRIALSTVAELSAAAEVQPSALMRFCQILGFSGFSEMQKLFRATYPAGLPDYATRLRNLRERGAESPSALLAEFVDAGRTSLENLARTVDSRVLDQAVVTLSAARLIHVIGLRRAFPVAAYLTYAFDKMQIPSMLHDAVGQLDHRCAIGDGDALIAISFAPYSQETLDLSRDCLARGIPVVALTDAASGPLHRNGVMSLSVSEVDVGAFRALSATLSVAITLAVAIGTRRNGDS